MKCNVMKLKNKSNSEYRERINKKGKGRKQGRILKGPIKEC